MDLLSKTGRWSWLCPGSTSSLSPEETTSSLKLVRWTSEIRKCENAISSSAPFCSISLNECLQKKCFLFIALLFNRTTAIDWITIRFSGRSVYTLHQHDNSHGAFSKIPLFKSPHWTTLLGLVISIFVAAIQLIQNLITICLIVVRDWNINRSFTLTTFLSPMDHLQSCLSALRAATSWTGVAACRKGSLCSWCPCYGAWGNTEHIYRWGWNSPFSKARILLPPSHEVQHLIRLPCTRFRSGRVRIPPR